MAADTYVGLMSGTSTDGVDAVLACFDPASSRIEIRGHHHLPFSADLKDELLELNRPGPQELHRAALAANRLSATYAEAVHALLQATATAPSAVVALGAHGQTVRHRPGDFDGTGYTTQLINGAYLAERTGIDVVCDFRSRDVAAGGQGAPLVPAFHQALFGVSDRPRAVLNLGGIANLTLLDSIGSVQGHDCGPANVLLDLWCERHLGTAYDADGAWAAGGVVDIEFLERMLDEPFFLKAPPKSTGRDLFNAQWLDSHLDACSRGKGLSPQDVQATLAELTARSAVEALLKHLPLVDDLLLCGGGALNADLWQRIAARLPDVTVRSTASVGIPPMQVEAAAFAWLAHQFTLRKPANCPDVTGARGSRVLGCLYPA